MILALLAVPLAALAFTSSVKPVTPISTASDSAPA